GAHDVAADPAKPVDANFYGHCGTPLRGAIARLGTRHSSKDLKVIFSDSVHALYTVAIVVLAVLLSPWFAYQAIRYRKYIGSLSQRMGYLPVQFNTEGADAICVRARSL